MRLIISPLFLSLSLSLSLSPISLFGSQSRSTASTCYTMRDDALRRCVKRRHADGKSSITRTSRPSGMAEGSSPRLLRSSSLSRKEASIRSVRPSSPVSGKKRTGTQRIEEKKRRGWEKARTARRRLERGRRQVEKEGEAQGGRKSAGRGERGESAQDGFPQSSSGP